MKEEGSSATKPCTRFNGFKGWILRSKEGVRGTREGSRERGKIGGGRVESGKISTSSFFLLPSSFFLLPSSFFLLLQKLTLESGGSNCRI
jgi:hypothetical protein